MRYKYYVTRETKAKMEKWNLGHDADEKLNNLLMSASQLDSTAISANVLVDKFNNHSGLRFIWQSEIQQDVCIYVLRRIYRHDEYSRKLTEPTRHNWIERHALSNGEREELQKEFDKFLKKNKRESLPDEFRKYEEARAFDKHRDVVFYEMPLWKTGLKQVPKDHWMSIQELLSGELYDGAKQLDPFLYKTVNDFTVTFRVGTPNASGLSDIYLLQIVKGREPNIDELIDRSYDCDHADELQYKSSKCYPDYYTYDYETWKSIEEDDTANLALSEEEVRILQNVQFPFFASGLAGSGKSTILYYLYANIYKYEARQHPEHNLLFLSYNETLVKKARESVRAILSYHHSNESFDAETYFSNKRNEQHFNQTFVPFRDFLKSAFLDEHSISRFDDEKHITYEKFCELYAQNYTARGRRLSPSILWSVIRTFIKGRSLGYLTPEQYNSDTSITRGDRTVDAEVYAEAYKVWNKWYRHYDERGELWDDLDLVRYVLTHGDFKQVYRNYAVIFCDEAQDFTKLEIDLILSLSKHSAYNLSNHPEDRRIPIAFAGDPNQTINPTGFRWASTKALFNESFREALGGYSDLEMPELSKNYRSQLGIVKLANTIQSIRYRKFDETSKERKLQSVREGIKGELKDEFKYVGFYSYDLYKDTILENLSKANIITSGDGDEDTIENFPDIKDSETKLKTAIGTKGLEYNAVMLLNFCTPAACRCFQKILTDEPFRDDSERFEAAYFFTKLYIAISRAREQLFIVDTEENYEAFWKYFTDQRLWEALMAGFVQDDEKRKLIGHIAMGDIATLPKRLSETYDPEANGRQEFEKAKNEQSAGGMRTAQSYYMEAGLTALADECDAYIFLYNHEYEKAGDKFIALNQTEKLADAINAYWRGRCWKKLIDLLTSHVERTAYDKIRLVVAQFMSGNLTPCAFLAELADDEDHFQDAINSHLDDQPIWKDVLERVTERLQSIDSVNITISLLQNVDRIARFVSWYANGLADLRANLHFARAEFLNEDIQKGNAGFRSEGYEKAVKIWECTNADTSKRQYMKAKKLLATTDSEEIVWMDRLNENDEIVKRFGSTETATDLDDEAASIVFASLLKKDFNRAVAYPFPRNKQEKWKRMYSHSRVRFLTDVVLSDFSLEKFYFLSDKALYEEHSLFEDRLPKEIFEEIFALTGTDEKGRPYWSYFTSQLKNSNGERVMKTGLNRTSILDAISRQISQNTDELDKNLTSCFLDFLFDQEFDGKRADNYRRTIVRIFESGIFCKEDFRRSAERNKYFANIAELDDHAHDVIKDSIRKYVQAFLSGVRKASSSAASDIKALMRTYEICVPYQAMTPDYHHICATYYKWLKDRKFEPMRAWMEQRILLNQYMDDTTLLKGSYAQLLASFEEKGYDFKSFTTDLSREDAAMLVAALCNSTDEYTYERTYLTARLIYTFRLRRDHLKPFCRVNDLVARLRDDIDVAIDELLANKDQVNEYGIKILAYTWEALYEHHFVANHYNNLVEKKRLARLRILTEYLKKRALLHYSYLQKKLFEEKQEDYGIPMSKTYLPAAYPHIEEKSEKTAESNSNTAASEQIPKKSRTRKGSAGIKSAIESASPALDDAKAAQLAMAKNLQSMGVALEVILQAAPLLTPDDLK